MDSGNLYKVFVISESENVGANVNLFDNNITNMATNYAENQIEDDHLVNLVEGIMNTTPSDNQNVITEQLYTDTSFPDGKVFITLKNAENSNSSPFIETPASVPENEANSLVMSPVSPTTSENSTVSREGLDLHDDLASVISPTEVFTECKRKRGRRPKSQAGIYYPPLKQKQKKIKAYENFKPYDDKKMERKRLNAINAKRHRDMQKKEKEILKQQLDEVVLERDNLKKEVQALQKREEELLRQVDMFKKQAFSLVSVFQNVQ